MKKGCDTIVEIVKRCWPLGWIDFDAELFIMYNGNVVISVFLFLALNNNFLSSRNEGGRQDHITQYSDLPLTQCLRISR